MKATDIKVKGDYILIAKVEIVKDEGGIILRDEEKDKVKLGEVIGYGPGAYIDGTLIPVDLEVGDIVYYNVYAGLDVNVNDEDMLVLKESEILMSVVIDDK